MARAHSTAAEEALISERSPCDLKDTYETFKPSARVPSTTATWADWVCMPITVPFAICQSVIDWQVNRMKKWRTMFLFNCTWECYTKRYSYDNPGLQKKYWGELLKLQTPVGREHWMTLVEESNGRPWVSTEDLKRRLWLQHLMFYGMTLGMKQVAYKTRLHKRDEAAFNRIWAGAMERFESALGPPRGYHDEPGYM